MEEKPREKAEDVQVSFREGRDAQDERDLWYKQGQRERGKGEHGGKGERIEAKGFQQREMMMKGEEEQETAEEDEGRV